jgi:prephenate dehydrogenase
MTVAGVGLIGGSLALAARAAGLVDEVIGYGRTRTNLETAQARGIIDRIAESEPDAADAAMIVLAAPVASCAELARRFRRHARPETILTDVGSVKARLVADLEAAWIRPGLVVGAHPIAGSEQSGAAAARADLFQGRRCIVTPTTQTDPIALDQVRRLWEGVGAVVDVLPADVHDAILARVSHLPHLVAYALVQVVCGATVHGHRVVEYAGTGLLDTTRIAASPAEIWRDILVANAGFVRDAVAELRGALDTLDAAIERRDTATLDGLLAAAAAARRRIGGRS